MRPTSARTAPPMRRSSPHLRPRWRPCVGSRRRRLRSISGHGCPATMTRATLAVAGFYGISWQIVALILAINSGYAAMMSIEDTRPFWHPFITTQCFGLAIAYFVNAAAPWYKTRPLLRLACAVAMGTAVGYFLVFFLKGRIIGGPGYRFVDMFSDTHKAWTLLSGFGNGLFVSLFFLIQFREARSRSELLR